jgi:hypothetical protein
MERGLFRTNRRILQTGDTWSEVYFMDPGIYANKENARQDCLTIVTDIMPDDYSRMSKARVVGAPGSRGI